MFETLTKGFRTAKQRFQGLAELDEATVDEALKDVRTALLEADVGFDVVQDFCKRVKEKAVGVIVKVKASTKEKVRRVSPEDHFVKLCHDELVELMGPVDTSIKFAKKGPTGIMLVGLQGSGKTTTIGKLARFLEKQHKRPLLVAADVYRPAAIEQLKIIGDKLGIPVYSELGRQAARDLREGAAGRLRDRARRHPVRHRRPSGHRRAAHAGAVGDRSARPPGQHPADRRRDDRAGRGRHGQGVQRSPQPRRRHPHQAGRRRARRRRAVGQGGHRQADQVRRYGRVVGAARGVPPRRDGQPHPGARRRRRPRPAVRGGGRRGEGRAGRDADAQGEVRHERLPRADRRPQEDGAAQGHDGEDPRDGRRDPRGDAGRRPGAGAHRRHDLVDDRRRAPPPGALHRDQLGRDRRQREAQEEAERVLRHGPPQARRAAARATKSRRWPTS